MSLPLPLLHIVFHFRLPRKYARTSSAGKYPSSSPEHLPSFSSRIRRSMVFVFSNSSSSAISRQYVAILPSPTLLLTMRLPMPESPQNPLPWPPIPPEYFRESQKILPPLRTPVKPSRTLHSIHSSRMPLPFSF